MPINTDTWSAKTLPSGDLAYDAALSPTLRGVILKAPGSFFFIDIDDNAQNITVTAHSPAATGSVSSTDLPYRLDVQIKQIVGDGSGSAGNGTTGTDIALADIIGLR